MAGRPLWEPLATPRSCRADVLGKGSDTMSTAAIDGCIAKNRDTPVAGGTAQLAPWPGLGDDGCS